MTTPFRRPGKNLLRSLYAHGSVFAGRWYYEICFNFPVEGYDLVKRSLVRFDPSISDQNEQQACFRHVSSLDPPLFSEASDPPSPSK